MPSERSRGGRRGDDEERPGDRASYERWLRESLGVEIDQRLEARYDAVVNKVKRDFEDSELWRRVSAELVDYDGAYRLQADNYPLFLAGAKPPTLVTKSFDSYVLKTFRRNVSENELWPEPPPGGWIVPRDGFGAVNDLVRTSFVVKYLDGVEFLADRLAERSRGCGCSCTVDFEARMEGHYAAHLSIRDTFQVPGLGWDSEAIEIAVEIQIITQLQEVIRRLTHRFYEARRAQPAQDRVKWQWNYKSDEFTANYLGHILHYVEGMIMEVRTGGGDEPKGADTW